MESIGKGYFTQTKSSGVPLDIETGPNTACKVKQGFLEFGNVDMATEFMNLADIRNLLTANFKVYKVIDKLYEQVHYTISKSA